MKSFWTAILIPLIGSSCMLVHVSSKKQPVPSTPDSRCLRMGEQVPIQLRLKLQRSAFYKDRSIEERRAKFKIYQFIGHQIEQNPYLRLDANSPNVIFVRLQLLDPIYDKDDSAFSNTSTCLSVLTLLLFPMYGKVEDRIQLDANPNITNYLYNYRFARHIYLGWLLIPYNIVITPFVDSEGITLDSVDFDAALENLSPRIQQDLSILACAFANAQK